MLITITQKLTHTYCYVFTSARVMKNFIYYEGNALLCHAVAAVGCNPFHLFHLCAKRVWAVWLRVRFYLFWLVRAHFTVDCVSLVISNKTA